MYLSGRVERAFGTFISFRGFAPFGELAASLMTNRVYFSRR